MADYFTGYTNLANPQNSLADMMNLASGVQQYQQAQQMNPLALQQRQLELEKAKALYAPDIARAQAESQRAQTEANVAAGTAQPRIGAATSEANIKKIQELREFQSNAARELLGLATKKICRLMILLNP